jgi:hypothetical protein
MVYYAAIKRNEILTRDTMCVHLENMMPKEKPDTKTTSRVNPFS